MDTLISFVIEQIHDIIKWVTGGSGGVDEDKLRVEIARRSRLQAKVRKMLDLRIANPELLCLKRAKVAIRLRNYNKLSTFRMAPMLHVTVPTRENPRPA